MLALGATAGWAEEAEVAAPDAPPAYRQVDTSAVLNAGIGAGLIGDFIVGELGLESRGLRTLDTALLIQWDALLAVRMGELANSRPYTFFAGGTGRGAVELGRRFAPHSAWSPYLGVRLAAQLQALAPPGVSGGDLDTINNSDGFGGLLLQGSLRGTGGLSYLTARHSLLVVGFIQERLRAAQTVAPSAAFTDFGLSLRFDIAGSWTLFVEGAVGVTRAVYSPPLRLTDQTTEAFANGGFRKWFQNGLWLGLQIGYGRELHHVIYLESQTEYGSVGPPNFTATASFGFSFSRQR
jgi:hypothetical protein